MDNDIEIVVTKKDKAQLDQLGKDAKKAGQDVADGLKKGFREGEDASERARRQIGKDLDKTAQDAKEAGGKAGHEFGTQFGDNIQSAVSGGTEDIVGGLLENVKGAGGIAAAGAGVGLVLFDSIKGAFEERDLGGMLAAQLGGGQAEAARFGRLAGKVYGENYGDGLADAADGIRAVIQNKLVDKSATEDSIKDMTELAMTAAKVVGEEANVVSRAARQMLVTGLAGSAEEAFDLIVAASQRGLNVNDDLIDTVVEYSTKFRDLGLSGQDALGLISQAMEGGARDTDTAADALKEFAIRAQDGSESTARGFETIGLSAQDMGSMIAKGGNSARTALAATLEHLKAIHDPVMRDQAAVDLFGTKAEDLGDALYSMDLSTVSKELGNFAGAADGAGAAMETSGQKVEKFFRGVKEKAADGAAFLIDSWGQLPELVGATTGKITGGYSFALKESKEASKIRAEEAAHAWEKERTSIKKVTVTLEENISAHKKAMGIVMSLAEAQIQYQASIDDATETLKKNGKTLDINSDKGRENKQALLDVADAAFEQIEAMEKQGATAAEVTGSMEAARNQFIDLAVKMGMNSTEARKLADQLKLIPGDYRANIGLNGADIADNMIRTLKGRLIDLTNRPYVASVSVTQSRPSGGGRMFVGLANGGPVGAGMAHAAEGGPRGQMVVTQEQGPEIGMWPDGSMIIPAGLSRAMVSGWMGGGDSAGEKAMRVEVAPNADSAAAAFVRALIQDNKLLLRVVNGRVTA